MAHNTGARSPRELATRIADTRVALSKKGADVWVATASAAGTAHLIPVSLAWVEERVVIAIRRSSITARNLEFSRSARLGVGPTRDVVIIDAILDGVIPVGDDAGLHTAFLAQADWNPRESRGYCYMVLRPQQIQAWREVEEIADRTLMRDGAWLDAA